MDKNLKHFCNIFVLGTDRTCNISRCLCVDCNEYETWSLSKSVNIKLTQDTSLKEKLRKSTVYCEISNDSPRRAEVILVRSKKKMFKIFPLYSKIT